MARQLIGIKPGLHKAIKNYLAEQPYNEVNGIMALLEHDSVTVNIEPEEIEEANVTNEEEKKPKNKK